jgi:RNA polymerase sigma factor FliA
VAAGPDRFREGMSVVEAVAKRIARRMGGQLDVDDLRGIGHIALLRVAEGYDPSRAAFATYASHKLKWAIFDEVRKASHGRSVAKLAAVMASERLCDVAAATVDDDDGSGDDDGAKLRAFLEDQAAALAMGLATSAGDVMRVADESGTPEDAALRAEVAEQIRRSVAALEDRERALVERHYYGGEAFDAIAVDLGISKSWASRIHAGALKKVGRMLREEGEAYEESD